MKKTLILFTLFCFSTLFCSCILKKETSFEDLIINSNKPLHTGDVSYGRYNSYSYNIYTYSMEILALDSNILTYHAEIFDTNKDGTYDTVWIIEKGSLKFGSLLEHKNLIQTASPTLVNEFIGLGHVIRKHAQNQKNSTTYSSPYENIFPKNDVRKNVELGLF